MQSSMDGECALVTGASAGIGRATSQAFAREGANVALIARTESRLREVAEHIEDAYDVKVAIYSLDVTDADKVDAAVADIVERLGGINVVVNNAGISPEPGYRVDELPVEQFQRVMAVNTFGMYYVTQAVLPYLRRVAGQLIFVGSYAGHVPYPNDPIYGATKWWTRGFAKSLAGQEGERNVGISVVNPAEVRTEFGGEFDDDQPQNIDRFDPDNVAEPGDIAETILFTAKQEPPNVVTELDLYRRDKFSDVVSTE